MINKKATLGKSAVLNLVRWVDWTWPGNTGRGGGCGVNWLN